jgi:small-conductance mechanosensitive channel
MNTFLESLATEWQNLLTMGPRILSALLVFLIFVTAGRLVGRAIDGMLAHRGLRRVHRSFVRYVVGGILALIGIVAALNILGWQGVAASILAGGGLTAVVLGFAFREIGENFLAGFILAFSPYFNVGDVIESEDYLGEVRGIELRHTHIRTADGRDIYIPSSQILKRPLVNLTKDGLRRPSFTVGIDYGDDPEHARRLLLKATRETPRVLDDPPPGVEIATMAPAYLEIEVHFWINTFDEGTRLPRVRTQVMQRCREALLESGFTLSSDVSTRIEVRRSGDADDADGAASR